MNDTPPTLLRQFVDELKRRRVMRVATLYVLALWPIIQIVDILSPAIDLPPITMRYLLIAFVAGLPVALLLSWLFDLNREGLVRASDSPAGGHPLVSRSVEIVLIAVLGLAVVVLFYLQSTLDLDETAPTVHDTTGSAQHSIAVLPFVSFSGAQEDERFSDGLTEELLNVLARIRNLRVIARTTSFSYKGVNRNVQEIGQELNVATILEGSVRRNDIENRIRVTAQLIDVASGTHLWSRTFDREFRDIFQIQDDIAAAVVRQLNMTLGEEESRRLRARSSASAEAMVAFGMGQAALARRTEQSLSDAERYFRQAIASDPGYTEAHAELANAYSLQAEFAPERREELLNAADLAVQQALSLDAQSGAAYAARGLANMIRAESDQTHLDAARADLGRAIELNPSLAMANMWYGNLMDDPAERERYHRLAFELDPRSPVAGYNLASDLLQTGHEAEAMEIFSRIVDADPHYPGAYRLVAQLSELRGRLGEALRNYEKVYRLQPVSHDAAKLSQLWIDIGDFERARDWLVRAEAKAPPEARADLKWLKISALVASGDRAGAMPLLQEMLHGGTGDDPMSLLNAARAAYFLEDYPAAVAAWERLSAAEPGPRSHVQDEGRLEVQVSTAYAYQRVGEPETAAALLAAAEQTIDERLSASHLVSPSLYYVLAQISTLKGEQNRALIHLQRAVDEGWRQHWRPTVEPCLAGLIDAPAFAAMMQGLATRLELIREQIAFDESFDRGWQI